MLTIIVGKETFNEITQEFAVVDPLEITLEHSLVSLSKWESKYEKPFLLPGERTNEEVAYYIECMVLSVVEYVDEVPTLIKYSPEIYYRLSRDNHAKINDYVSSNQSATTFSDTPEQKLKGRSEVVTSELIYYWMASANVPFECETWHLNRLFNLLRIVSVKNTKPKKMSKSDIAARNRQLNTQRKAQLGTTG